MDRGAWRAIVHAVSKSQTRPSIHTHTRTPTHTHPPTQRHEPRTVGCLYKLEKTRKQILPTQRHEPRTVGCLYKLEKTRKQILPETHFGPVSVLDFWSPELQENKLLLF